MSRPEIQEALTRLDDLTRRLRAECPWDRQQDERSIVPHTVEEAYELADAANAGDDSKLLDELGDVLFQVHFLSLLMEERGAGDLAQVAEHCRRKLVRRHPHVFPDAASGELLEVEGSQDVLRNWDAIKAAEDGREGGIFGDVPENLPATLLARKAQQRAAASGFDVEGAAAPLAALQAAAEQLETAAAGAGRTALFREVGDVLFAAVNVARKLQVDPELALRASSDRFRARIELAEALAGEAGERWNELAFDGQLEYYAQAGLTLQEDQ